MSDISTNNPVGFPKFDFTKIYIFVTKSGSFYKLHRCTKYTKDALYCFSNLSDSRILANGISSAEDQIKHAVLFGELKIFTSLESFIFWMHNKITE